MNGEFDFAGWWNLLLKVSNIFFIRDAGGNTFAAGPAKFIVRVGAGMAKFLERALMEEGDPIVIERSA